MPDTTFRLALVQMRIDGGLPDLNSERAALLVGRAARAGAAVVLLPEALPLGWTHPSAKTCAEPVPDGPFCQNLRRAAIENRVYVCSGIVERSGEVVYNAAVLVSPAGEFILHHRKIYELDLAAELYAVGDSLAVARTPLGTFGLMICADGFVEGHAITRALGFMGADVILSPSSWAVPAEHDNTAEPYGRLWLESYGPPAREFGMWIAGASNVGWIAAGPWKGRKCIGCSLVVGPSGDKKVTGPYGPEAETIVYAEILRAAIRPRRTAGDGPEGR